MVNQGKTTAQFPVKTTLFDLNDRLVFVYGADTANVAQTATISVSNYINSVANSIQITIASSDPATSSSLTIASGSIFATANFLYVATANNFVQRIPLTSF